MHLSHIYYQRAEYQQSRRSAIDTLQGFQELRSTIGQAIAYSRLGLVERVTGDYVAARSAFEAALALVSEKDERSYASCLDNLAGLLCLQGDYAAARSLYERALQIMEQALGLTHPDTALTLNNLAELLREQGDYATARPLYERALQICEQALGPTHVDTAFCLDNLARLLLAQGDYAAALPLHERALQICLQALGPTHPHTLIVRKNRLYTLTTTILSQKGTDGQVATESEQDAERPGNHSGTGRPATPRTT